MLKTKNKNFKEKYYTLNENKKQSENKQILSKFIILGQKHKYSNYININDLFKKYKTKTIRKNLQRSS